MTAEIQSLLPQIHEILARSDLSTISAKAVRKELASKNPGLDIKLHKAEIDTLTGVAFASFTEASSAPGPSNSNSNNPKPKPKPKRPRSVSPPPTSSPAYLLVNGGGKKVKVETDEELAHRLHAELNGTRTRTTRGAASGSTTTKKKATWGKKKKADDGEEKKPRKLSHTGFNKPHRLSEALARVVGTDVLSRPQVTKQLWVYIKANDLQDPNKKTDILPDHLLKQVLPFERISSFAMAKEIGAHLYPYEGKLEDLDDFGDDDDDE